MVPRAQITSSQSLGGNLRRARQIIDDPSRSVTFYHEGHKLNPRPAMWEHPSI